MNPPPSGSIIKVEDTFQGRNIIIPKPRRKWEDIGGMLFLCFWLCGWAVAEVFVVRAVWQSLQRSEFDGGFWFMVAWLAGWTVGGVFAIKAVCDLAKGEPAEIITIGTSELTHRKKGTKVYRKADVTKVHLETSGGIHLLYIDSGAYRIYIGEHIRAPEREWLHSIIKEWKGS